MPDPDTRGGLLAAGRRLLNAASDTAALDARLLLQHVLFATHEDLIAEPDVRVPDDARERYHAALLRRVSGEPVSRIMGYREFYGRRFDLSPAVLDPRPDTETVVDLCFSLIPDPGPARILDLGLGSGILAVTLLAQWPAARATGVDLSPPALEIGVANAIRLGVGDRLTTILGSWFANVEGSFDLIVSNPPYIATGDVPKLEASVANFDPQIALDGGEDGLTAYRAIANGAGAHLNPGARIVVEIGAGQEEEVVALFRGAGLQLHASRRDLGGHVRALAFGRA